MAYKLKKEVRFSVNNRKKMVALVDLVKHRYVIITLDAFNKLISSGIDAKTQYKELIQYLVEKGYIEEDNNIREEAGFISSKDYPLSPPEPLLKNVYWEITGRCNFECKTCFANSKRRWVNDLSLNDILKIIDKIAVYNPVIQISGGEPFLRRDIVEIISYMKMKKISKIIILTNGSLLKKELVYKLKEYGVEYQVSLDGATPETNDFIRGKGAFQRALCGLEILKNAKVKNVLVKMTITKYNIEEIDKLGEMVKDRFGYSFSTSLFEPSGRGLKLHEDYEISYLLQKLYQYWAKKVNDMIEKIELSEMEVKETNFWDVNEYVSSQLTLNGYPLCSVGRRDGFMIDPKGNVFVCPSLRTSEFKLGNILLEDVDPVEFLRRWTPPSIDEFSVCSDCTVKYFCVGGGCIARNYAFNGSLTIPSPYCKLFGVITEGIVWDRIHELRNKQEVIPILKWMRQEFEDEARKYEQG